jgi:molybdopterin converting factor small subunit
MEIEVKLFATLRDYLPPGSSRFSCRLEIAEVTSIEEVLKRLSIPEDTPKIILVNGIHAGKGDILKEGDVLSVFPPVAGG